MKIDHDYLKRFLDVCEAHPTPDFSIFDLKAAGIDYEMDEFMFHARILHDDNFLVRSDGEPGIGYMEFLEGGDWFEVPLRLTARGHEFIATIRSAEVWSILKQGFKDASLSTLWSVGKSLAEGFAQQKLKQYLPE